MVWSRKGRSRIAGLVALGIACLFTAAQPLAASTVEATTSAEGGGPTSLTDADRALLASIDRLSDDGRFFEAEDEAKRVVAALDVAGAGNTYSAAVFADRLTLAMLWSGRTATDEALAIAQRAVLLKESIVGPSAAETADSLVRLGEMHRVRRELAQSKTALERALPRLVAARGAEHLSVADAKFQMGRLLQTQGQYQEARAWLEQAHAIGEKQLGSESLQVADALHAIGIGYGRIGNSQEAIRNVKRAVEISERAFGPDSPRLSGVLYTLGHELLNNAELAEARIHLEHCLRVAPAVAYGRGSRGTADCMVMLANVSARNGKYAEAIGLFERAIAMLVRTKGRESEGIAAALYNLAWVYQEMGDNNRALQLIDESVLIRQALNGPRHYATNFALGLKADILRNLGRDAEARDLLIRVVDVERELFGAGSPSVAAWSVSLAFVYGNLGEFDRERKAALEATRVLESAPDDQRADLVRAYRALAGASEGLGEIDAAVEQARHALALSVAVNGARHPDTSWARVELARMLVEGERPEEAVSEAEAADEATAEHLALTAQTATESEALAYALTRASGLDLLVTMIGAHGRLAEKITLAAWNAVLRTRVLVLDEVAATRRSLLLAADPGTQAGLAELRSSSERLASLIVRGPGDDSVESHAKQVEAARAERQRLERDLASRNADFRERVRRSHADVRSVSDSLPTGSALVAFVRYHRLNLSLPRPPRPPPIPGRAVVTVDGVPSYAAFVLPSAGAKPAFVPLGDAAQIEDAVSQWREAIVREPGRKAKRRPGTGASEYRDAGEQLRRLIWGPVAASVRDAAQILIVPDGALNLVDFATLPTGKNQYLIEVGPTFHYLSSENDVILPEQAITGAGLLAVSNPDFDGRQPAGARARPELGIASAGASVDAAPYRGAVSRCMSLQSMRFERLPASDREAREIAMLLKGRQHGDGVSVQRRDEPLAVTWLTGSSADETTFKRMAAGRRVLHLATHGFFVGGDCSMPQGAADRGVTGRSTMAVALENPLLLSGLALAGANNRRLAEPEEDDGILTAEEISTLNLSGTEWVVLSACDTGLGEIRSGEGVFGLRRAFQLAGAQTVLASLWPVEDEVARRWMTSLYRQRYVGNDSTAGSARHASLSMLRQRRSLGLSTNPFYWAGFIAVGDWR